MSGWPTRAAAVGTVMGAVAQELWSPRSSHPLASALGWTGPWALAGTPWLAIQGLRTRDPVVMAGAVGALGLTARRRGGHHRPGAVRLRVYVHNLMATNRHPRRVADGLLAAQPDIAVLSELHDRHVSALERAFPDAHMALRPSRAMAGIGVISRLPIDSVDQLRTGLLPGLVVRTAEATVVALHLPSPGVPHRFHLRTADQLAGVREAAEVIAGIEGPLIVAGDLNATRWNPAYRRLVTAGRLTDAVRTVTRDWFCTYPTRLPVVRIDHCLVRGFEPRWARRLPAAGSDHLALLVGLG